MEHFHFIELNISYCWCVFVGAIQHWLYSRWLIAYSVIYRYNVLWKSYHSSLLNDCRFWFSKLFLFYCSPCTSMFVITYYYACGVERLCIVLFVSVFCFTFAFAHFYSAQLLLIFYIACKLLQYMTRNKYDVLSCFIFHCAIVVRFSLRWNLNILNNPDFVVVVDLNVISISRQYSIHTNLTYEIGNLVDVCHGSAIFDGSSCFEQEKGNEERKDLHTLLGRK